MGSIQGAGGPNWLNDATGIYVQDDYAYVASNLDNALTIFDISTPAVPTQVGEIRGALNFLSRPRHISLGVPVPGSTTPSTSVPSVATLAATEIT